MWGMRSPKSVLIVSTPVLRRPSTRLEYHSYAFGLVKSTSAMLGCHSSLYGMSVTPETCNDVNQLPLPNFAVLPFHKVSLQSCVFEYFRALTCLSAVSSHQRRASHLLMYELIQAQTLTLYSVLISVRYFLGSGKLSESNSKEHQSNCFIQLQRSVSSMGG